MTGIHDVVGIGFGPANLALAIALEEHAGPALSARFVERQPRFGWHRGMLIEDADMQVSYLKDLATLRNPTSRYGFLSYLHAHDRMLDFINYGTPFPSRIEFHDYLEWAAAGFAANVDYGHEVVEVRRADGAADVLEVVSRARSGALRVLRGRNVVVATGLTPHLPPGVGVSDRVWHNRDLLTRLPELDGQPVRRIAVVGAGQSAAETTQHLHRTFPDAQVTTVFSRYGFSPADGTPFANRIFDPSAVDDFHAAPDEVKAMLVGYHGNTNYSVVDADLIQELYRTHYRERVRGTERLRFRNATAVHGVVDHGDRVELDVASLIDGDRERLALDLVVFATGYRPVDPLRLLGEVGLACRLRPDGLPDVRRDHRVVTDETVTAGIYLQGSTQHTHGLSATLLSNVAVRSGEIVASLVAGDRGRVGVA